MNEMEIRVLLVEDDEDDFIITDELISDISSTSYKLDWVSNYQDALPKMAACQHDIYLVDYRLGIQNGLDLIRDAIGSGCNAPIILLTGQGGMEVDLEAMETGVADYLIKNKLDSQVLERSIRYSIERYREQEKLRRSELRYRLLFETTQEGIIISNGQGELTAVNPAAACIFGYDDPDEMVGLPAQDFYVDAKDRDNLFERLVVEKTVGTYELTVQRKDGSHAYLLGSATVHLDDSGEIMRTEAVFTDITERKKAEEALRESKVLNETILEMNPDMVYIFDLDDKRVLYSNEDKVQPLGFTLNEPIELNDEFLQQALHPADMALWKDEIIPNYYSTEDGEIIEYDQRMRHVDGTWHWFHVKELIFSRHADGNPKEIYGVLRDITEQKQHEEQLQLQAEMLGAAANAILIADRDGMITYINPAFTKLTGFEAEEVLGQNPRILNSGRFDQAFFAELWQTITSGKVWQGELINRRKNGSLYHEEMTITPVRNRKGDINHFIAIKQNISQRIDSARALQYSENLYRAIVEDQTELINRVLPDGTITFANQSYCRFFGKSEGELIGSNIFSSKPDDEVERKKQKFRSLSLKNPVFSNEFQREDSRGEIRWLQWTDRAIFNDAGEVIEIQGVGRDITHRVQAEKEIQRQLDEQILLNAVAVAGSYAESEDQLIEWSTRAIGEALYSDHFGVLLLDEQENILHVHPSYRGIEETYKERVFRLGEGVVGEVVVTGLAKRISDVRNDSNYIPPSDEMLSEICVPLRIGERVIGVINAENHQVDAFSDHDERILQTIAGNLATAIDRIRAEEAERQQRIWAEALRDTTSALNSTLDINEIFDHILDNVDRLVKHDATNLRLIKSGIAEVVSQRGYTDRGIDNWIASSKIKISEVKNLKEMVETLQPYLIPDTSLDPTWVQFPATSWIKSYLAVPIRREEIAVGVISLDSETPNFFTEDHAQRLQVFADQVSVALENATLYRDALESAERRSTLHNVSQEIIAASRSPQQVYETIHKAASKLMPCEAFAITTANGKKGWLEAVYLYDKGQRYPVSHLNEKDSFSETIIKNGKSVLIADLENESDLKFARFGDGDHVRSVLAVPMQLNGNAFGMIAAQCYRPNAYSQDDRYLLEMLAAYAATTLESARLFDETQEHAQNQETLNLITRTALASDDYESAMQILADQLKELLGAEMCFITIWDDERNEPRPGAASGVEVDNYLSLKVEPGEVTLTSSVLEAGRTITIPNITNSPYISARLAKRYSVCSMLGLPLKADGKKLGAALIGYKQNHEFSPQEIAFGENAAAQVSLAMAKIRLLDETHQRAAELEAVAFVSESLREARTRHELPPIILNQIMELLEIDGAYLATVEDNSGEILIEYSTGVLDETGYRIPAGKGIAGHVVASGETYISHNVPNDPLLFLKDNICQACSMACVPLITQGQIIGALGVTRNHNGHADSSGFANTQIRLMTAIADITANGLRRAELHDRTQEQLARLTTLHEIDTVISSSFDLHLPFNTLLEKVTTQLGVDAAAVLLLDENLNQLVHAASRGFHTAGILNTSLRLGDPHGGVAALQRRTIIIDDLEVDGFGEHAAINKEGFVSYVAIPLMSKGKVNGVLELFNRSKVWRDSDWIDFVNTLATQASIAINNTQLFNEAQRSNMDLTMAYDATIEGWSRALEMRDLETEGHSQRVTEMTLELARAMNLPQAELVHIRRGALLHDIGKMVIPDSILHKPGTLTEEEWEIMRQHPVDAYNLLAPIAYLRQALDIPHYHHEKWDGSGYPRGLKRTQIPLAARIFAVIDVWDALNSDRPYRKAWSQEKVIEYLKEQAGTHFDPEVIDSFLGVLKSNKEFID